MTHHQLRRARRLLGWSVARLAVQSGTSEFVISKYEENGRLPQGYPLDLQADPLGAIHRVLLGEGLAFSGGGVTKMGVPG